ncbi:MAG: CpXC domain-containing protein [Firmicutes bacterium]|nr:CpXC domain-containing protein [Bacillota bacterium]
MDQILEKVKIRCEGCGNEIYVGIKEFVDVTDNPADKQALLDGTFFVTTCRECGDRILVEYPIMYVDRDKKLTVYMLPGGGPEVLEQLNSLPVPEKDVDPEAVFRLVTNGTDLIEKILIFDNGRDDRLIELYKLVLAGKIREDWPDVTGDDLLYYSENGSEFFIVWDEDLDPGSEKLTIILDEELYQRLIDDFSEAVALEPNKYALVDQEWIEERATVEGGESM